MLDHDNFEVKGAWEKDRGPQELAYDFWWHLGHDRVITSEWGTPNMVEAGVNPELLLGNKYGHRLHVFDMKGRRHVHQEHDEADADEQHRRRSSAFRILDDGGLSGGASDIAASLQRAGERR